MKKILRGLGLAAAGLFGLVAVCAAALYAITSLRFARRADIPPRQFAAAIPTDSASLARGKHLATAIGKCAECHGDDFAGKVFIDAPPLGRFVPANLTPAGLGSVLTPQQWSDAVRRGVRTDGKSLYFMPSEDYGWMSDRDLASLIAYMKTLPAVGRDLPDTYVGPVGRALYLAGQFPVLAAENAMRSGATPLDVPEGPTVEYGRYLANVGGCTGCHGPGLSGGKVPGTPPEFKPAANITPAAPIGQWTEAQFASALRTGIRPNGTPIDPFMPIKYTKLMTDVEMSALYAYLRTVPPKPYGGR